MQHVLFFKFQFLKNGMGWGGAEPWKIIIIKKKNQWIDNPAKWKQLQKIGFSFFLPWFKVVRQSAWVKPLLSNIVILCWWDPHCTPIHLFMETTWYFSSLHCWTAGPSMAFQCHKCFLVQISKITSSMWTPLWISLLTCAVTLKVTGQLANNSSAASDPDVFVRGKRIRLEIF